MNGKLLCLTITILVLGLLQSCTGKQEVVRIAVTTDVHGTIYPYDFIKRADIDHSLAHLAAYLEEKRSCLDTSLILLDNGDFLQGQPTVYYYNFLATGDAHISAEAMNYLGYDAASVGNHDIEAGPDVYRRLEMDFDFPWLAANAVDAESGKPVFAPYTIIRKGSRKIAVLGMITPGVPKWLPENLWPGMEFRDMTETAKLWVPQILDKEKPDLLIGLFHSGMDPGYGGATESYMNENAAFLVAEGVPGFDIVIAGHDHKTAVRQITNNEGQEVLLLDPGSHARYAGEILVNFKGEEKEITARNIPLSAYEPDSGFMKKFAPQRKKVTDYLEDTVCYLENEINGLDALFGPSSLSSLIHRLQLQISDAEISFTAPLSIYARLGEGPLLVSDLFKLYRFENMLYVMELSGKEVDGFLEHAAAQWFDHPDSGHLLKFSDPEKARLANPYYNFSTAAGIYYSVDITKEEGDRIEISTLADGSPFHPDSTYRVALNSYRGNGGGGHLEFGSGIPRDELADRIVWFSERDLRYHLLETLSEEENLKAKSYRNWTIIPDNYALKLSVSDRYIFEQKP